MNYGFTVTTQTTRSPDHLAYQANDLAARAKDAEDSYKNLHASAEQEARHPAQQKFYEALRSRRMLIYGVLALAFFLVVFWEWEISSPIYGVFFPAAPMLALIGCIAVAFYASVCLGECSDHFSLLNIDAPSASREDDIVENARRVLYGGFRSSEKARRWFFSPVMGALLAAVFLCGIYLASRERVLLQEQAGELPQGATLQEYLPVILYGIDILLGIPTFFVMAALWGVWRNRRLTGTLSAARGRMLDLRRIAVSTYSEYLGRLVDYNASASNNRKRALVPPNQVLRQLLTDEFGYDPTSNGHASSPENERPVTPPVPPTNDDVPPAAGTANPSQQESNGSEREQDLLSLLDEQINIANRSF